MKRAYLTLMALVFWASNALAQAANPTQDAAQAPGAPAVPSSWDFWPFGPGYGEGWLPVVARFAFVAGILFLIGLFLRLLMGPKGPLRDKWIDEEAAEETAEELAELEQDFAEGKIDEYSYKRKKKRLTR